MQSPLCYGGINTTSRKTHWEDRSHHGDEPWTLDSEHAVDVFARRISGRGGTRTPGVSLCLIYSQVLSPLSHSPKERGAEAPALVSMLSSPVARGVGAFGIRTDKPPPTSAWMESGLISHSTIEFTINNMSDRELSPSLLTFRNSSTSPVVSANLAVAIPGDVPSLGR